MSQRKRSSRSGPLPDISTASIRELTALPAEVLRLHLSNHHLTTTGTKAVMARRLFNAIHTSSSVTTSSSPPATLPSITTPTPGGLSGNMLPSSSLLPTSTLPGAINPAQLSTLLQLLSQTLQQNPSVLTQQVPASNSLLPQPPIGSTTMFPAPTFSASQRGPATTLPTTSTSTIIHAPPPRPQETNEDALSTASDIPLPTTATPGEYINPSVSQSLPPVPLAVQQRILKGEFIDFNSLLPEVMFSTAITAPSTNASRSTIPPTRINSFSSWLDAWNVYIAIIVAQNPSRASELLEYQRLIHSASKHFSTPAWLNYDVQFRTLAASNPQLRWNSRHPELWLENLASQTSSSSFKTRFPCIYCGSIYHFPDRCPCCPFRPVQSDNLNTSQ